MSRSQLKKACAERYVSLKQHVLDILIQYQWLLGEASERGLRTTDGEVQKQLEQQRQTQLASPAAFRRYLSNTGLTMPDVLMRVKFDILETDIFGGGHTDASSERRRLRTVAEFNSKWKARTDCRAGYVIRDCKQYKGP